jgi:hypothetical protein
VCVRCACRAVAISSQQRSRAICMASIRFTRGGVESVRVRGVGALEDRCGADRDFELGRDFPAGGAGMAFLDGAKARVERGESGHVAEGRG